MTPEEIKEAFQQLNIRVTTFNKQQAMDIGFVQADAELLAKAGLPDKSTPGHIHYRQLIADPPEYGITTLAKENPNLKNLAHANDLLCIGKDGSGNQLVIALKTDNAVFFEDHDYGVFRYANQGLRQFLEFIILYHGFILKYKGNETGSVYAGMVSAAPREEISQLMEDLKKIDASAFKDAETFWCNLAFEGLCS